MSRKYFGTDGVRGTVGQAPITPDFVMKLGYAAGKVLTQAQTTAAKPIVLIGKDTRISGYMLEAALEAGLAAAGVDVMLAGPMPTPAVAYLTRALRLSAGVVISASHNPYLDNGIKFFSEQGNTLPDAVEAAIEAELDHPINCVSSERMGKAKRLDDAHGAAYHIAPDVFHELGAEVIAIGVQPNGVNINDGFGATMPATLSEAVQVNKADLGIALDGDADRLLMVDASGRIYNGDELLYVMVKDRMSTRKGEGAVGTLMTNMALEVAFKEMGVEFARAKVGDRYVLEVLQERGWLLGGEGSGHLLCLDKHSTGDGIISALQVLSALKRSGKSLAQSTEDIRLYPQSLINVKVPRDFDWQSARAVLTEKESVERELGQEGRVLIRASGTEPLIRVMVEAKCAKTAEKMAKRIAEKVGA